jgi:hypothetical protein
MEDQGVDHSATWPGWLFVRLCMAAGGEIIRLLVYLPVRTRQRHCQSCRISKGFREQLSPTRPVGIIATAERQSGQRALKVADLLSSSDHQLPRLQPSIHPTTTSPPTSRAFAERDPWLDYEAGFTAAFEAKGVLDK